MNKNKGFTLIELLVVIGILAVLLAITLIAINPTQQLESADNTKRRADVNAILNAINQYGIENGLAGLSLPSTDTVIGDATGQVDICDDLVPTFIAALPQDPDSAGGADITDCDAAYSTGYEVRVEDGRVTVSAPDAVGGETIEVTR